MEIDPPLFTHLCHIWELSNKVLYDPVLKGASKVWQFQGESSTSLSEFRSFNFDLLYFWYPLRYRVIQYPIGKLSDMVKMIQDDQIMAALSTSIRKSWKVWIYYINGALLILNLAHIPFLTFIRGTRVCILNMRYIGVKISDVAGSPKRLMT